MSGKFGSTLMCEMVVDVAKVCNVIARMVHKGGLLSLLPLIGTFNDVEGMDFAALKQELGDVDATDRADVEAAFLGALDLGDPAIQAKVVGSVGYLETAIDLVSQEVALVENGISLYGQAKSFLGL